MLFGWVRPVIKKVKRIANQIIRETRTPNHKFRYSMLGLIILIIIWSVIISAVIGYFTWLVHGIRRMFKSRKAELI